MPVYHLAATPYVAFCVKPTIILAKDYNAGYCINDVLFAMGFYS
jgi:hypothetical protein